MYISKNQIVRRIRRAATNYKRYLVGKTFMFIYDKRYIEVMFTTKAFFHLTGVNSNLTAINFYKHAILENGLKASEISFDSDHPFDFANLKTLAEKVSKDRAIRLISELSKLENDMKSSTQRLIIFQAGIIRLCDKEISSASPTGNGGDSDNSDVYARLDKIENYLRSGGGVRVQFQTIKRTTNTTAPKSNAISAIAGIGKDKKPAQYWKDVVNNFKANGKIMLYTNLLNTDAIEVNDMTVGIEFPKGLTPFGKTVLENPENKAEIVKQVSIACGKTMQIKYIDTKPQSEGEMTEEQELSNFANEFDIPFGVIE